MLEPGAGLLGEERAPALGRLAGVVVVAVARDRGHGALLPAERVRSAMAAPATLQPPSCSASSTARTPPSATASATGSPRRATPRCTTCRSRSTAPRCSRGPASWPAAARPSPATRASTAAQDDLGGYVSGFETLGFGDLSLLVKVGVQFGLFGGAVLHLGTERHHERYLADIASLELPGCFAMTEDGHGSDVQHLRTTATYDAEAEEFVIDTPDDDAHKMWIGNAARDGRMAAVFAQLIVGGEERGVHALLVPLRDERRHGARRDPDRGLRAQARPRRRRQRQALVRRRARPARGAAGPLRDGLGERHVLLGDREPDQALLLDARHADPGPRERRAARRSTPPRSRSRSPSATRTRGASSGRPTARR